MIHPPQASIFNNVSDDRRRRRHLQTRAYFGFSHRTAYLAVCYMDRFCLHRCMDVRASSNRPSVPIPLIHRPN